MLTRFWLLIFLPMLTIACEQTDKFQPAAKTQPASGVSDAVVTPEPAPAKIPEPTLEHSGRLSHAPIGARAKMLAAFQKDIAVCGSAMNILGTDRVFIETFQKASARTSRPVIDFLHASPFSGSEEIQHILNNPEYFELGVNMHESTIAAAWIKDKGIYCAPTRRRLDEIEAWGESAEAWKIREFFLDKELQLVDSPDDIAGFGIGFNEWKPTLLATANFYSTTQRPKLTAWIKKAIKHSESWRSNLRAIDGVTPSVEEMNITIDSEVLFLKKLI